MASYIRERYVHLAFDANGRHARDDSKEATFPYRINASVCIINIYTIHIN